MSVRDEEDVVLNESDRRRLREIELGLSGHDPRFAARMTRLPVRHLAGLHRWVRRGHDLVVWLSLSSAMLCLVLAGVNALPAAGPAVALGLVTLFLRRRRFPRHRRPGGG